MLSIGMSMRARDVQARQRRIRDNDRQIKLKALIQKRKDELRAQLREEIRQREVEDDINHSDEDSNEDRGTEEDEDCLNRQDGKRDTCFMFSCFVAFVVVSNLIFWQYLLTRTV